MAYASSDPPAFLITPTRLNFGYVPVGSTAPQQAVRVKNVSGQSQLMSGSGGAGGVFGGTQNCQGQTLAPGASCHMYYAFSPTTTGPVNGSTSGTWNGQSFSMAFLGTGTPRFLITPTRLNFGYVKVGHTSAQQAIRIQNLSNHSVVMSGSGGAGGVFGGTQNCQGQTLAPLASCHMYYAFSPTTTGAVSGSTSGTWNGQSFSLAFLGTGN
jgi:hypothetical protein